MMDLQERERFDRLVQETRRQQDRIISLKRDFDRLQRRVKELEQRIQRAKKVLDGHHEWAVE